MSIHNRANSIRVCLFLIDIHIFHIIFLSFIFIWFGVFVPLP
nr:MAG TPA: hypothetical protein [Caudoviricetes sp.]